MRPYYQDDKAGITIYHGRCEDVLPTLAGASIDAVICDPPYGTTACAWDTVIPFDVMWRELKRLVTPRAPVVLFGSQPFTSELVMSNRAWFRAAWIWEKQKPTNFLQSAHQPLRAHEDIVVFGAEAPHYNPQGLRAVSIKSGRRNKAARGVYRAVRGADYVQTVGNYPRTVLTFATDTSNPHPTAKPVALMAYLVRTYTDAGDLALDFAIGSGTTLDACKRLGRRAIGIETVERYCEIAARRLSQEVFDFGDAA